MWNPTHRHMIAALFVHYIDRSLLLHLLLLLSLYTALTGHGYYTCCCCSLYTLHWQAMAITPVVAALFVHYIDRPWLLHLLSLLSLYTALTGHGYYTCCCCCLYTLHWQAMAITPVVAAVFIHYIDRPWLLHLLLLLSLYTTLTGHGYYTCCCCSLCTLHWQAMAITPVVAAVFIHCIDRPWLLHLLLLLSLYTTLTGHGYYTCCRCCLYTLHWQVMAITPVVAAVFIHCIERPWLLHLLLLLTLYTTLRGHGYYTCCCLLSLYTALTGHGYYTCCCCCLYTLHWQVMAITHLLLLLSLYTTLTGHGYYTCCRCCLYTLHWQAMAITPVVAAGCIILHWQAMIIVKFSSVAGTDNQNSNNRIGTDAALVPKTASSWS